MSFLNDIYSTATKPPEPEKRGIADNLLTHYAIGANKYVALPIAGMAQIAGDISGIKSLSDMGNTAAGNAEAYIADKEQEQPSQKFQDIRGIGDAVRWASEQTAEMAPQIVTGMVAGGVGAAAGRALAPAIARTGLATAETLAGIGGKEAAAIAAEHGAEKGAQAALALRGAQAAQIAQPLALESSTIYQGMKDGEKDPYRALTYGALAALPDVIVPSYILEKTGAYKALPGMRKFTEETPLLGSGKELSLGQRAKDIGKTVATATTGGVGQEALQTVIERIGSRDDLLSDSAKKEGFWKTVYDKGLKAAVHPAAWDDIVESAAAGGLMGGLEAVGGHGLGHLAEAHQQNLAKQQQTGAAGQTDQTGGIAPVAGIAAPGGTSMLNDSNPQPVPLAATPTAPAGPLARAVAPLATLQDSAPGTVAQAIDELPAQAGPELASQQTADTSPTPQRIQPDERQQLDDALTWARGTRRPELYKMVGESQSAHSRRVLDAYQKSQAPATDLSPSPLGPGGSLALGPSPDVTGPAGSHIPATLPATVPAESGGALPPQPARQAVKVDPATDDAITAIAKLGGIDHQQAQKEWGSVAKDDRVALNKRATQQTGRYSHVFKKDGLSLDGMREALVEHGYLPENASINDLHAIIDDGAGGKYHYSTAHNYEASAAPAAFNIHNSSLSRSAAPVQSIKGLVAERRSANAEKESKTPQSALAISPSSNAYKMAKLYAAKSGTDITGWSQEDVNDFVNSYRTWMKDKSRSVESPMKIARLIEDRRAAKGTVDHIANAGNMIDAQAHEAATSPHNELPEPTQAQKEAGNYKLGHVRVHGLDISIENPAGSMRRGVDESGKAWQTELAHHYGYIKGTIGKDKDHLDAFIGPKPESDKVFVVDQIDPKTGKLDEHKTMLGFDTLAEARAGYLANYDKSGPSRIGAITETTVDNFKEWLKNGDQKKAFAEILTQNSLGLQGSKLKTQNSETPEVLNEVSQVSQEGSKAQEEMPDVRQQDGEQIPGSVAGEPTGTDRRKDDTRRKLIDAMTPEEMRVALRTDELTGLNNRRAYNEARAAKFEVSADADSLGWVNKKMGQQTGDELLRSVGQAFHDEATDQHQTFHISGDEFRLRGDDRAHLDAVMERVRLRLTNAQLSYTTPDKTIITKKGIGLSYGIGTDATSADDALIRDKEARAASGERSTGGNEPPGVVRTTAAGRDAEGNAAAEVAQASKETKVAQPAKVADSGEELTYNKRNRIRTGVKWADVADKNEALKAKEVQKPTVYPKPDYVALVDGGMQPLAAHIVKQVYDGVAVKPAVRGIPTDADYQRYIEAVNRVMAGVLKWANDPAAFKSFLDKQVVMADGMAGRQISLTDIATATDVKLLDVVYPEGWKAFRDEVHILGGNKLLQALQPGYDESKRALKDINLGWPAKAEAWQRQGLTIVPTAGFEVVEVKQYGDRGSIFFVRKREGKSAYNYLDAAQFHSREEAQAYLEHIKPFALFNKRRRLVDTFATEEEAKEAARTTVKKEGGTTVDERGVNVADAERTGPAYREEEEDVTSDRLREVFGFRGVNFGNWVPNDERQLHLNHAYDSFMDLAGLLNVPPRALSLDNMLGLAIGAQGNGGNAAAHFVPGVNEINITRTAGAGSVAHEWAHALDHYFATQAGFGGASEPFLTMWKHRDDKGTIRPEIVKAFADIVQAMEKRQESPEETAAREQRLKESETKRLESWLAWFGKQFAGNDQAAAEFAALADRIRQKEYQRGEDAYVQITPTRGRMNPGTAVLSIVADVRDLAKKYKIAIPIDNIKALNSTVSFAKYLEEKQDDSHEPQSVTTQYKNAAMQLDKGKKKPYWSTPLEMFARAFDAYIVDRLAAQEQENSYLAHLNRTGETVPMGAEREKINKAFDTLLGGLKTKETEKGTALFALDANSAPDASQSALPAADIEKALAPVLKSWKNAPTVQIVQSVSDLPRNVQLQMLVQGISPQQVQAVFLDGVTLVADNLSSVEEAQQKLLHETVAHYGLRSVLDPETFRKQMLQASLYYANKQNAKWKEIGKTYGLDLKTVEGRIAAAEEMIAHEAETGAESSVLTRIIAAVREFLRKAGFHLEMADAEIREMLAKAQRFLEGKGGNSEFGVGSAEGARFAAAWHGSPHDFEAFKSSQIGTGEGAQSYGYGLYFAGKKEVAEFYKDKLSGDGYGIPTIDGIAVTDLSLSWGAAQAMILEVDERPQTTLTGDKAKEFLIAHLDSQISEHKDTETLADIEEARVRIQRTAPALIEVPGRDKKGKLYHVELAPQEDEYLLWDKPLSEQSEKVQEVLPQIKEALGDTFVEDVADRFNADFDEWKGSELYKVLTNYASESPLPGQEDTSGNLKQDVSTFLHSLGIRGIKYLDGTSRSKGEGNYNYVVFNDADVAITAKFALRDTLHNSSFNLQNLPAPSEFLKVLNPLDWSRSAKWFDHIAPDQVKAAVGWFARNPVYEAEKDANKAPFVEAGIKREEDKVGFQLRMMKWDGTYGASTFAGRVKDTYGKWKNSDPSTAWGRVQTGYAKLSAAEQTAVNGILVQGDQRFMNYKTLDGAMKNPRIAALKPTPAAFQSYLDVRNYIDNDLAQVREDIFRELAREAGLSKAETEKHIADYRNDLAKRPGWMPRNHGEGQHQANVYHVVEALRFETKDLGEEEANRQQAFLPYYAGPQVTGKLVGIVNGINRKYGEIPTGKNSAEARKAYPGLKFGTAIKGEVLLPSGQMVLSGSKEDIAAFLKASEGVLDDVRAKKETALDDMIATRALTEDNGASRAELREMDSRIEGAKDTRNLVKVYMRLHESRKEADKTIAALNKDLKGEMPANFRAGEKYETSYKVADNLTESIYGDIAGDFAVEQVQMKALKKAVDAGEISADEAKEMRRAIIKTSAETLMGRGAGRHQIGRAPYLIEGYDTDSPVQLYHDYMTATAGMLSKAQYAKEQFENYRYAPAEVKQWAETYIRDSLRNMGLADRVSGNARMVASFWYLGGKMSSILVNGTQPWTLGVAELGRRTKQNSVKTIAKAQLDIMRNRLTPDEQELFNSKVWKLQEMETAVHEVTGSGEGTTGKVSQFLHELTNKAMMPFQEMEMMNRRTVILAAYRAAIADGKPRPEAIDFALDVNRKTNFEMSRANLPGWARKPLGRTAYALQSFVWNNWNWIYNRATSGEKADMLALLKYSAMIAAIGGAGALAGGDEADKLYRRIYGRSIKLDLQNWTRKHLKEFGSPGEMLNAFIWHGGIGATGINISNAMRLNIPMSGIVTGESTAGEAAMGVFAGLLQKGQQTGTYLQRGMYGKALESAAPEMLASPLKGYRMATEGITTGHGKPVFDENGKPVKYTATEGATRSLGFQPLAQSERTEVQMTETKLKAYWNDQRKDLLDSLRGAGSAEARRGVTRDIMKFNQDLNKSQVKGVVLPIKAETMRSALIAKPDKKEMAWKRGQL